MKPIKLSIKLLILTLLAFAMIGTYVGSVISSVIVSKNNLEKNYLIENQYYAQKLANTTDSLFRDMFQNLSVEALDTDYESKDSTIVYSDLNELLRSTAYFNSTWFVDAKGHVIASAPKRNLEGTKINSIGVQEALQRRVPLISEPYTGITGNLLLLISVPVYDRSGFYLGFLAGTIHLHEENSLKMVLGQHPEHGNDSYVYVVDSKGNIIYHPNGKRINDNVKENEIVKEVMQGKSGSLEGVNSKGITMLAGYAATQSTSGWGIVSQTPKKSVIEPTFDVAKKISLFSIPFMIFVFLISFILLTRIVNPIRNLAIYAQKVTQDQTIPVPDIPEWYFELKKLKQTILVAVEFYQKKLNTAENESNLDPLTGLKNRRSLEKATQNLEMYSVILFDIDHFKLVNDQYGHQTGDEVLKFVAKLVKKETRDSDLCYRYGGEEFLIILPDTNIETAVLIAERIRRILETMISPTGEPITISMGVGHFPDTASSFSELLRLTDLSLYKAKNEGRNRVISAKNNNQ